MEIKNRTWEMEGNSGFHLCFQKERKVEFKGLCQTRPRLFCCCSTGEWKGEHISSRPEVNVWCPSVVLARPSGRSHPATEPLHCPWMGLIPAPLHPLRRHWHWGPCPTERENSQELDQKAKPEIHVCGGVSTSALQACEELGIIRCIAEESESVPKFRHIQEKVLVHSPSAAPRHALWSLSRGLDYGLFWKIWLYVRLMFGWNKGVECKLQSPEARVLLPLQGWSGQHKAERHGPTRYWTPGASNCDREGDGCGRANVEGVHGK